MGLMNWISLFYLFLNTSVLTNPLVVSLSPKQITNGQISLLRVELPDQKETATEITAKAGTISIPLMDCPKMEKKIRCGLVPVPLDTKPGKVEVVVTWKESGKELSQSAVIAVKEGRFKENKLKVDPDLVSPSPKELERIKKEKEEIQAAYTKGNSNPLWDGEFELPTKGTVTSWFGNKRSFNGQVKSIHFGVDLHATTQTPIFSANAGRVLIAKEFFYAGNLVLIDHGAGLFSSYAHLSALNIKAGESIKKGQQLGMAGATGRVTGPHLHWGMRVHETPVDPKQALRVFNQMWKKEKLSKTSS